MIKKADEMIKEIREQMRGGKGSVEITHLFKQGEMKGKARLCAKITLNPGCSIGLHEHVDEEEIFYIIKGTALMNDNGSEQTLYAGDSILTGGGATHSVENIGSEPLEMIAVIILY